MSQAPNGTHKGPSFVLMNVHVLVLGSLYSSTPAKKIQPGPLSRTGAFSGSPHTDECRFPIHPFNESTNSKFKI